MSPAHRNTWAVPAPLDVRSSSTEVASRRAFAAVMRSPAGAGTRPEIGTPSRADCAIVCGDFAPLRLGLDTFGSAAVVGRPAGGV